MKTITSPILLSVILFTTACNSNGQTEAQKEAKKTAEAIKKTMGEPDLVATSANGYFMKATIDGKSWEAEYIYPTESVTGAGTVIGQKGTYLDKGSISIGLSVKPVKRLIEVGTKYTRGIGRPEEEEEGSIANFAFDEYTFGAYKGEITITAINDKWVEGTFYFTATSPYSDYKDKKHEITNGFFRVAVTREE